MSRAKHLILGAGNLGIDIQKKAESMGCQTLMLSKSTGWNAAETSAPITALNKAREFFKSEPDYIWCCVGQGSAAKAMTREQKWAQTMVLNTLPQILASFKSDQTRLVCFSSNYALQPELSFYATVQARKEKVLKGKPNTFVFRVANLYGNHKPLDTLPGKLLMNKPQSLPKNAVLPTPTDWIAGILLNEKGVQYAPEAGFAELYPVGQLFLADFAAIVLNRDVAHEEPDPLRPVWTVQVGPRQETAGELNCLQLWVERERAFRQAVARAALEK